MLDKVWEHFLADVNHHVPTAHLKLETVESPTSEEPQKHSPLQAWQLEEDVLDPEATSVQETLFTLGNGYLGLRGAHEERFEALANKSLDGTFINGFYESSPIHHPETSYGLAKEHQFMLNVPNAKCIEFSIDGEKFDLFQGETIQYHRSVDFRTGVLSRNIEWKSPAGKQVSVTSKRLVSFQRKNLFAIQYEIKAVNFSGCITLKSSVDGLVHNAVAEGDPRFGATMVSQPLQLVTSELEADFLALMHKTTNSGIALVSAITNQLDCDGQPEQELGFTNQCAEQIYKVRVEAGDTIRLTKYGVYCTSRDYPEAGLISAAQKVLQDARKTGFISLCSEQTKFLSDFWERANIEIAGNEILQQGVNFTEFQLLQSVGRDGKTSIAAKGLTGEGYGGHYFWDAEIYALPFYLYTRPEIAREMLEYRYSILDKACARAREMSHPKGALYAWRTINGEECSAFFLAGTAAYHINADIAYAIKQYYEATADDEFMIRYGAEMVMETARIWMDIGAYIPKKNNQFCINGVTGPDEYTVLVNNNFYTNAMAQMHLRFAADLAKKIKKEFPEDFSHLAAVISLDADEPSKWAKAAEAMYLPHDEELSIHPQDDTFLSRKIWDLADIPKENHPLLMHYHYLVIYRYQICKQADVVLATFLLGNQFTLEEKKRDYDYYEAITTHDSSLSPGTFSIMASEIGYYGKAYRYFFDTARGDLDNRHGNTAHGVHIAAMASTWMAIIYGMGGMRVYEGKLQFAPYLPREWEHYAFRVYFQSQLVAVEVDKEGVRYSLLEGKDLQFTHRGSPIRLTKNAPIILVPLGETSATAVLDEERVIGKPKLDA